MWGCALIQVWAHSWPLTNFRRLGHPVGPLVLLLVHRVFPWLLRGPNKQQGTHHALRLSHYHFRMA